MEIQKEKGTITYRVDGVYYQKTISLQGISEIPHGKINCITTTQQDSYSWDIVLEPNKKTEIILEDLSIETVFPFYPHSYFLNGFQSWTGSGEQKPEYRQKSMNSAFSHWIQKYHLKTYGDQHFIPYSGKKGFGNGFTYGYLVHETARNKPERTITLIASLSEENGYTLIQFFMNKEASNTRTIIKKDCYGKAVIRRTRIASFLITTGTEQALFSTWQRQFQPQQLPPKQACGWTSWYEHYEHINEAIILENLHAFSKHGIPLDYFQIDDGWQQAVGDWLTINKAFPNGFSNIVKEARDAGFKPGLWLAPFVAEESSKLCKEHADWILRNEHGPVVAGYNPFNWSGNFYSLDSENPEVRKYLKKVFHTIFSVWGFSMVKVDFLYSTALIPRNGKSRGEIMSGAMNFLREIAGNNIVLGCGVPLGCAFGKVDYCRIGSDISLMWEDWRLSLIRYPERVSTLNSLKSTLGRHHLNNRFFGNDPDVSILRSTHTSLSLQQKKTLFLTNNLFGGICFISDNISEYSPEQLALYYSSFPLQKKYIESMYTSNDVYDVHFYIGNIEYIAYINLSSKTVKRKLFKPVDDTITFWYQESMGFISSGSEIILRSFESQCFSRVPNVPWKVAGSTSRLFPGSEIEQIIHDDISNTAIVTVKEGTLNARFVYITIPESVSDCTINGHQALIEQRRGLSVAKASLL